MEAIQEGKEGKEVARNLQAVAEGPWGPGVAVVPPTPNFSKFFFTTIILLFYTTIYT